MLDKILEILEKFLPIWYGLVPVLFGVYLNTRDKLKKKREEIDKENHSKNLEKWKNWKHDEYFNVVRRLKDLCNYYKDKGHMDLVNFIQLSNGNVAISKLSEMFVTVLAEDSRHGNLPKLINKITRIPYPRVACWFDKVRELKGDFLCVPDADVVECNVRDILENDIVKSSITAPIFDPQELFIGVCVFYFEQKDYGNVDLETRKQWMMRFKAAVEGVFLDYHLAMEHKLKELKLTEADVKC